MQMLELFEAVEDHRSSEILGFHAGAMKVYCLQGLMCCGGYIEITWLNNPEGKKA